MRCVIVTGMSGAGKSTALKMLEDMGYFCVDNLPVPLIPKMAELLRAQRLIKRHLELTFEADRIFLNLKRF